KTKGCLIANFATVPVFRPPVLSDWLFKPLSERSADSLKRKRVAFSLEHGSSTHFGCDSQWR
ncbi:hypothetical protein, partial [Escherichia coli]|uniref:hypothetical protein n=1 Tax=Escherichia coli TaxID=562 RepID=UPI00194F871A